MSSGKIHEAVVLIRGVMSDSVKKAVSDANQQLGLVDKKTMVTAAKYAAMATAAATALGAIAVSTVKAGLDAVKSMNDISIQTGATGKDLQELEGIARNVWSSGKGENFQEVADALINIRQAGHLTGDALEAATNNALLLKDSFKFEVNESTRAATALMKNFGITADEAYGLIAVGAQNGANKNGDLLDTLNEYSAQYQALGLNADQFVTSLIKGAEAGSFSIDKVGDAVKDFNIRAKDGSKSSAEAYAQLGLDANVMTAAFAAGGDAAQAAFFKTIETLDAMQDPIAKNQAGVALFGTMYEDLEKGVLQTMKSMKGAGLDAEAELKRIEKIKYEDINYAITRIGRSFTKALLPGAKEAGQKIYELMPKIEAAAKKLEPIFVSLANTFAAALPGIIDFIVSAANEAAYFAKVVADNWGVIGPIVYTIAGGFALWKTYQAGKWLLDCANSVRENAKALLAAERAQKALNLAQKLGAIAARGVGAAFTFLTSPIGLAVAAIAIAAYLIIKNWDTIKAAAVQLGQYLAGVWEDIKAGVSSFLTSIGQFFTSAWTGIKNGVSASLTSIGEFFTNAWTSIKDGCASMTSSVTGLFSSAFSALPGILKAPMNAAISLINGAINAINGIGFTVPDWVPGLGGKAFAVNIPNIPMLAKGGFTTGPSIAGEAGQEAVISFNPAYRAENIGYLQKAAARLGVADDMTVSYYADQLAALGVDSLTPTNTAITYNLGGLVFSPTVTVAGGDTNKESIIEQLRNYHGELLELIEELLQEKEAGSYGTSGVF